MSSYWGVRYTIEKICLKVIRYCICMSQIRLIEEDLNSQIFETIQVLVLGLPLRSRRKKCHLDVAPTKSHKI